MRQKTLPTNTTTADLVKEIAFQAKALSRYWKPFAENTLRNLDADKKPLSPAQDPKVFGEVQEP